LNLRSFLQVTREGVVFAWGRGVNGQLGLGAEQDLSTPTQLGVLSKGEADADAILATAQPPGEYIAAADRYAVVPDGTGNAVGGGNGAVAYDASGSLVPTMQGSAKKQRMDGP